jgi:transposase-like protein
MRSAAPNGQVSEDRVNYRNGYRPRRWDTRAGTIELTRLAHSHVAAVMPEPT